MELIQIRYFLEVAETKYMTNSAKNLHISQPALSPTRSWVKESWRSHCLHQKAENIVLTEYGRYLQKKLKPILSGWTRFQNN